jgi:TetR/AcrR family transcriptional repressor of nem operon
MVKPLGSRSVKAAAQLFRERGFDGIGVADLMKAAGLTHGGFYGHFSSKDDLIAEAAGRALTDTLELLSKQAERTPGDPLNVARQGHAVRRAVTGYVRSAVDLVATLVPGKSKAARRQKAIGTYATLVGAMVMARVVDDRALSQEILDAGLASVKT